MGRLFALGSAAARPNAEQAHAERPAAGVRSLARSQTIMLLFALLLSRSTLDFLLPFARPLTHLAAHLAARLAAAAARAKEEHNRSLLLSCYANLRSAPATSERARVKLNKTGQLGAKMAPSKRRRRGSHVF